MRQFLIRSTWIVALAVGIGLESAQAEPLSLGTGLSHEWNIAVDPLVSPLLYLPVNNDSDTNGLQLTAFTFRLLLRPLAATGTLAIDLASIDYADVDGVITANQNPIVPVDNLPDHIAFSGLDTLGNGYDVADGQFLAMLRFTTPDDARGTFELVAVTDDTRDGTGWLSSTNVAQAYTNLPFNVGAELVLGTITVVPEPGSALLAVAALASFFGLGLRKRMFA